MKQIEYKEYPCGPNWYPGVITEEKVDPIVGEYYKIETPMFPHPIFRLKKEVRDRE